MLSEYERCGCDDVPCTCKVKKGDIQRFKRCAKALLNVLNDVKEYLPTDEVYLEESNLLLMTGPSHTGYDSKTRRQDRVVCSVVLHGFDGGAW